MWDALVDAAVTAFTWSNLLWMSVGVAIGLLTGAMPGLGAQMAIAVALPFTLYMPPLGVLSLLIGIYKGVMFGASLSAILLGTPGTPQAAPTALDGHALAKQGKAGKALGMALYASVFGDTVSDVATILLVVPLAALALKVGPTDMTTLIFLAVTLIAFLSGPSVTKGLIAALIGALLGLIGTDPITGRARMTFGLMELESGIGITPFSLGLFAIAEVIGIAVHALKHSPTAPFTAQSREPDAHRLTWAEWKGAFPTVARSTVLGTIVGVLPGLGSTAAAFLGYALGMRTSKHPERYGKGSLEGVAAAEAANSATAGPTLVPLFALGIPGGAIAALFGAALMMQGITPGPLLLREHPQVMYPFFILLLAANVVNLGLGRALIRWAPALLRLPATVLFPGIVALCVAGVYASEGTVFSIGAMLVSGVLGYALQAAGFPLSPLILAFILSPMLEQSFRQSLLITDGSLLPFITRPIAAGFLVASVLLIVLYWRSMSRMSGSLPGMEPAAGSEGGGA